MYFSNHKLSNRASLSENKHCFNENISQARDKVNNWRELLHLMYFKQIASKD